MTDYPLLTWEMYATDREGNRVYCGHTPTERGADAHGLLLANTGYTQFEKRQVVLGNAGQSTLPRVKLQ